jgi:hypothetical protein
VDSSSIMFANASLLSKVNLELDLASKVSPSDLVL